MTAAASRFVVPVLLEQPEEPQPIRHKRPCAHCPSAHGPGDPEADDIKTWPHEERVRTIFPCGWAPVRYCRGYCDSMGISAGDVTAEHAARYLHAEGRV